MSCHLRQRKSGSLSDFAYCHFMVTQQTITRSIAAIRITNTSDGKEIHLCCPGLYTFCLYKSNASTISSKLSFKISQKRICKTELLYIFVQPIGFFKNMEILKNILRPVIQIAFLKKIQKAMKKYKPIFYSLIIIASLTGCVNFQEHPSENIPKDATTHQTDNLEINLITHKITPSIWVETTDAKAAADYYLSIFKDGRLKEHHQYTNPEEAGGGKFETATVEIAGMDLNILAAGPFQKFNESVSFVINCKDQEEVDYYWNALTADGGEESSCGWCKDKYGLSWQVVPVEYFDLINSEDPKVRDKAMTMTLQQKKIILAELK